jgi:hypothetical protein
MTKLTVIFRNSTNAPKNHESYRHLVRFTEQETAVVKDSPYKGQKKRRAKYLCREGMEHHNTAQQTNTNPVAKRPANHHD